VLAFIGETLYWIACLLALIWIGTLIYSYTQLRGQNGTLPEFSLPLFLHLCCSLLAELLSTSCQVGRGRDVDPVIYTMSIQYFNMTTVIDRIQFISSVECPKRAEEVEKTLGILTQCIKN
jgi:hypothetical protein